METQAQSIMFGSFECTIQHPQVSKLVIATEAKEVLVDVPRTVDPFAKLAQDLIPYFERRMEATIRKKKNGTLVFRHKNDRQLQRIYKMRAQREAERTAFLKADASIITTISIAGGSVPSALEEPVVPKRPLNKTASVKQRRTFSPLKFRSGHFEKLLKDLKNIAVGNNLAIEVIGKRANRITYVKSGSRVVARMDLQHMSGKVRRVDCVMPPSNAHIVGILARTTTWGSRINCDEVVAGDSGKIFQSSLCAGNIGRSFNNLFIVRGRYEGKLFDARSKITINTYYGMQHFSNAENFWKGLDDNWARFRDETDHVCMPNYSVNECGKVAALVTHSILPCYKITCAICATKFVEKTNTELQEEMNENLLRGLTRLQAEASNFVHVRRLFEFLQSMVAPTGDATAAFDAVFKLSNDKLQSPFKYINVLNDFFLRGKENNATQWGEARNGLLELARFQKNRTDNIKKGDIGSFRNKLSAKANYNFYLACDNQLDKNANFLWGQREYHAKRFFSNFFEEIDPTKGYTAYEYRLGPNGSRRLAIGSLIVPLDLSEFRKRMKGEFVKQPGTSKKCVSMRDGNFLYPCCCTTLDDGSAIESTLYAPTKKHLVIGNSGDAKYVDLPKGESEMLYVAREGYCYINVYLAMLVNVKEDEAKDFTKKVRDLCVPKLGKWPTLMDLATTCAQLRIFFPDVHDAELPRILVDHNNQTCHVVDSYGSITTGYHILKASTVSQLALFASDELESDIKHYRVGGKLNTPAPADADEYLGDGRTQHIHRTLMSEHHAIKVLIRGIFRPRLMRELLLDEPYIMLMSVVSPGILMAMFNNGAFEIATKLWINEKQSVAMIATALSNLAMKVSVAETLLQQLQIIEHSAGDLLDITCDGFKLNLTYQTSLVLLHRLRDRHDGDRELNQYGFLNYEGDVVRILEKNYLDLLAEEWQGLTWREKLSATWHARKQKRSCVKYLHPLKTADFGGMYNISPSALHARVVTQCRDFLSYRKRRTIEFLNNKCIGVTSFFLRRIFHRIPNARVLLSSMFIIGALVNVLGSAHLIILENAKHKREAERAKTRDKEDACAELYANLSRKLGRVPTWEEYKEHLAIVNKELVDFVGDVPQSEEVEHQKSTSDIKSIEHIVAFISLVIMMFDTERSDCVFKTLNKFKGIILSLDSEVRHQSLDTILEDFDDRNQVVDFELNDEISNAFPGGEAHFESWWNNQVEKGFTLPHYRTEGLFMEFTRANAAKVASDISHSSETDFLIRGAVGSGKSTGLPFHLSKSGRVLLIEPTRPLAENVYKQLSGSPFFLKPTMRMRGNSVFGSSPVSVMTSGFALHFYANNLAQLSDVQFVIIDECHVMDASAMAFRCLLHTYHTTCKVLKVSATPPGREVEFTTQHPVKLIVEESLSFKSFVDAQGSRSNADVIQYGPNILVYVASYNEVDQLSKLLIEKGYAITKVDGRTMKHGDLEIITKGTSNKPHFVVATNIIENGVTLDIDVVVDFGMKVSPFLDVDNRSVAYTKVSVSYGERIQRLGRVGRIQPGTALRIGHTEKGLTEIPSMIATEAALYCFAYNLPVMNGKVSTSLLAKCTVRQIRTMHNFELSPFFLVNFVAHDGTMHPVVHESLKKFKLRDSVISLSEQAIPYRASADWISAFEYNRIGVKLDLPEDVKVAFHIRDIPPKLHEDLWKAVLKYKTGALFPTIKSASVSKIAYTLSTDLYAIPRTLIIIDKLIEDERTKQYQYKSMIDNGCSSLFSIVGITNTLRAKYSTDYTGENIRKLEAAKAQLKEFQNLNGSDDGIKLIRKFESLQYVHHQSKQQLARHLGLKGVWNKTLMARDGVIACGVAAGGIWMLYTWFTHTINGVRHQGRAKSKRIQDLKFRKARDKRSGFEIDNNDDTIAEYFGTAYTKKGKGRGTTVGMGKSSRKFINMYGFEPGEFSYIRFVDPLTGAQIEENVYADIVDIADSFGEIRKQKLIDDEISAQAMNHHQTIHAYLIKDWSNKALKVDLTPHNPLRVGERFNGIAKYPERQGELRQTGVGVEVDVSEIPKQEVVHESKALLRGLRDYNPISQAICRLTSSSEHGTCTTYGIGFGAMIIANHHLFKSFNGSLEIRSQHGVFRVPNMMSMQVVALKGKDLIIIKMPKDFPVFPQRLHFRQPTESERVCLVGATFQEKCIVPTISETSTTHPVQRSTFWKHWISTDDGHCGLPIVSTADGLILGIHSLANNRNSENYYTAFDGKFESDYLRNPEHAEWVKNWKYNPNTVLWGPLKLTSSTPSGMFKTTKIIEDLFKGSDEQVREQGQNFPWMLDALQGNLQAIAYMKSQLVTKHVVKGECIMFKTYLECDTAAREFFQPKMWAYGKSLLNREAYIKDIMKYSKPIDIGVVNCDAFEEAICRVILYMRLKGFKECTFITDEEAIFSALNMKSAVGAMYGGKKKDYFASYTDADREQIVRESCLRLYRGDLGVWNGSLKAELRSKEKIAANKTRTFTAAPIDTLLGGKVCVDDFNNQFYSKNIDCCWTVGMTKFYGGWNRLLTALPDGWVYCDADGSQFDSSLTPYLINAVLSIRLAFMEDWDVGFQMLQNLYTEIIYTPISTPDGTIVKKYRGNNSGQPSTVVDNSLMVVLAMHYAFVKEGFSFEEIDMHCKFFVNGDDLLIAVSPDNASLLDNLGEHFSELGLNYDFSSRTHDKSQLWFMSHCGISVEGKFIPKLEEERIVSILQWDRAILPEHRLEAVCAAMIESWGYPQLTHEIRRFYSWLLEQAPYHELASDGKAPYISELALKKLYLNNNLESEELEAYLKMFADLDDEFECSQYEVRHQADEKPAVLDAVEEDKKKKARNEQLTEAPSSQGKEKEVSAARDNDVNTGTTGTFTVPRIKAITSKMRMPKVGGTMILNLDHLLAYTPQQIDISNTRSTHSQFDNWYAAVKNVYDVGDTEMQTIMNGLMVWCIENGTSPNINGVWTMMDGEEQVEYPLKPVIENSKPTFRQIMAHFSDVAEAYIEMRNKKEPYMPRYGLIRNLRDLSLARYAFDFYEVTSRTPTRAREAHIQMKAAALKSAQTRMFGLDGGISTQEENTERHTTEDVSPNMHTLLGVRNM
uniref:Genome polyprotein n=1 Tax=Pepper yellow mosaic virus TaxID=160358 RepID=A0A8F2FBV6_9POTV|nr:polyprotein [Pepper yellow mosaic virus]